MSDKNHVSLEVLYQNEYTDEVLTAAEWIDRYMQDHNDYGRAYDEFFYDAVGNGVHAVIETAGCYERVDVIFADAWRQVDPSRRIGHDRVRDLVIQRLAELRDVDTKDSAATIKLSDVDAYALSLSSVGFSAGEYALRVVGCDGPAPISDCEIHNGVWYHENSSELADIVKAQHA